MAATSTQNPAVKVESKSAKKKKTAKSDPPAAISTPVAAPASVGAADSSNGDGAYESPYIKELYK